MKNDGGPAYPVPTGVKERTGMSLRDWFAGQALLLADRPHDGDDWDEQVAASCYRMADAMLKARDA